MVPLSTCPVHRCRADRVAGRASSVVTAACLPRARAPSASRAVTACEPTRARGPACGMSSSRGDVAGCGDLALAEVEDPHTTFETGRASAEADAVFGRQHSQHVSDDLSVRAQHDRARQLRTRQLRTRNSEPDSSEAESSLTRSSARRPALGVSARSSTTSRPVLEAISSMVSRQRVYGLETRRVGCMGTMTSTRCRAWRLPRASRGRNRSSPAHPSLVPA